jgi:hypothetical protein
MKITHYTSFGFLLVAIILFYAKYVEYSALFGFLFFTSILYRSYTNLYTQYLDKLAILLVVSYGAYMFSMRIWNHTITIVPLIVILSTFLITLCLYYGGYLINSCCFCEDARVADWWHGFLHIISCFGHMMIVFLY